MFLDYVRDHSDNADFIYKGDGDMLVNPPMLLGLVLNHWQFKQLNNTADDFIIGCKSVGAKPYL